MDTLKSTSILALIIAQTLITLSLFWYFHA